jgi:hypothetical protein
MDIELEPIRLYLQQRFENIKLANMQVQYFPTLEDFDGMGVRMIMSFYGKKVTVPITYPRDWWQAFKERWFSKWLKVKYPVKYHTEYKYRICPHIDIPWKSGKSLHLKFLVGGKLK